MKAKRDGDTNGGLRERPDGERAGNNKLATTASPTDSQAHGRSLCFGLFTSRLTAPNRRPDLLICLSDPQTPSSFKAELEQQRHHRVRRKLLKPFLHQALPSRASLARQAKPECPRPMPTPDGRSAAAHVRHSLDRFRDRLCFPAPLSASAPLVADGAAAACMYICRRRWNLLSHSHSHSLAVAHAQAQQQYLHVTRATNDY